MGMAVGSVRFGPDSCYVGLPGSAVGGPARVAGPPR
jgi:hypothetical protein